jgi:hypothetical protein
LHTYKKREARGKRIFNFVVGAGIVGGVERVFSSGLLMK